MRQLQLPNCAFILAYPLSPLSLIKLAHARFIGNLFDVASTGPTRDVLAAIFYWGSQFPAVTPVFFIAGRGGLLPTPHSLSQWPLLYLLYYQGSADLSGGHLVHASRCPGLLPGCVCRALVAHPHCPGVSPLGLLVEAEVAGLPVEASWQAVSR